MASGMSLPRRRRSLIRPTRKIGTDGGWMGDVGLVYDVVNNLDYPG